MKRMMFVIAVVLLVGAGQVVAGIVVENSDSTLIIGGGNGQMLAGFDASSGDKLVVSASAEGAAGTFMTLSSITYGGVALSEVVSYSDSSNGVQCASIWYLDNPGAAGDIVVTWSTVTGGAAISAFSLSDVAEGTPSVTAGADGHSVDLDVTAGSFSVAAFVANPGGITTEAPLTEVVNGASGSSSSAAGYELVAADSTQTYSFTGGGNRPVVVAANFAAVPEPATLALLGLGAVLLRRKKMAH